jgi:hypothetical protein
MLLQIDDRVWVATQPLKYLGLSVGTRMTIIGDRDGNLTIISPIELDNRTIAAINEIGTVRHIIAPNLYHYLFAAECKSIYPDALFWAPPGLQAKRPELKIDREIDPLEHLLPCGLEYIFFDGFSTLTLKGFDRLNEFVFFDADSRSLILTDTAFNFDETFPALTQFTAKIIGGYQKLTPSILEKLATKDKESVGRAAAKVLAWDFDRVIVAHGAIVATDGKQKFQAGYQEFLMEIGN